jgi:Uma2 family endonuclease
MSTVTPPTSDFLNDWTAADMQAHLGGIPLKRIRMRPAPGTATEKDVLEFEAQTGRSCELIDGILVEKDMASYESMLALEIAFAIKLFLKMHDLGIVLGADGPLRILPRQVRVPDVCFISWERLPGRKLPRNPIFALAPDLAIEVLSKGNTRGEMRRKLSDYFAAGVRLVWFIDPRARTAKAYSSEKDFVEVDERGVLSGADVLPGFELPLRQLFMKGKEED